MPPLRPDLHHGWVPDPLVRRLSSRQAAAIAVVCVVALGAAIGWWLWSRTAPAPDVRVLSTGAPVGGTAETPPAASAGSRQSAAGTRIVVHVVGLVRRPGVVLLAPGARVVDAIKAAGGLRAGSPPVGINLARALADGEQIVVEPGAAARPGAGATVAWEGSGPGPAGGAATPGPVDLNTATVEQLDALPGVGPVLAQRIIDWRQANGRFTAVDQLGEVAGVGDRKLADIAPRVRV